MADRFTIGMKEIAEVLSKNKEVAATPAPPKEPANDPYSMKECMRLLCDTPGIVNGSLAWNVAIRRLEKAVARATFVNCPDPETRYAWVAFEYAEYMEGKNRV